jgi:hypothetical protein
MASQGINFSTLVYLPAFDTFAVDAVFYPLVSSPGSPSYTERGIFDTTTVNVLAENNTIYSDQRTILDIRDAEFAITPRQGDHVAIPRDCNGVDQGEWVIVDYWSNGGGQSTLTLRKVEEITKHRLLIGQDI